MPTKNPPSNAVINRQARDLAQEAVDNLREKISNKGLDPRTARRYRAEIVRLLRAYGHLGVR